ncbi:MAG: protein kinase [Deltaproteobacteria bacterium]|nr:protein kinase [Deltaproteobacteria bacterium]
MTQRDAPPFHGIDDDADEEKTSVGAAPDVNQGGGADAPRPPSPLGPAPRVHYGKFNTPTAFTPQPNPGGQAAQGPAPPPPPIMQDPRSSAAMTAARPQSPASGGMESAPPRSQAHPRPAPANPATTPRLGAPSPLGNANPPSVPPERGSSGPQPLTPPPPTSMMHNTAPPLSPNAQSGLMPFAPPPASNPQPGPPPIPSAMVPAGAPQQGPQSLGLRADQAPREGRAASFHITRTRAYSFVLDARGQPIELGSGRFAKAYLGEERWLESKTDYRKPIVIKILQKGVSEEDHMRFQMEKELLERVQGHPNIVELMCSGENEDPAFLPASIRDKVDTEFMILEKLEMSLEERLKGSRVRGQKEDLLACDMRERLFRVLDYMIPIASAVEYSHLVRNICHRDIKPANVLIALPDPNLRGATLQVRLADFNVAKLHDEDVHFGMTQMRAAVPGTLFFQSPEQETNIIELLVNVQQGLPEVEYFEDFYIQIAKNDTFSLFNRNEQYPILYADRARKRLVLARPYREVSETNVRARIQKSVGRPADIYSLGATFYYLISGAYANPKTLYDAFHKFIEYERADENNTIEAYLRHEYSVINSLRAPKGEGGAEVAPADRFFSYKHFLDGNGELIDPNVMLIIAKCMIRNKPDSYCQAHDLETRGISEVVADLINLYSLYGFQPGARPTHLVHRTNARKGALKGRVGSRLRIMWLSFLGLFRKNR